MRSTRRPWASRLPASTNVIQHTAALDAGQIKIKTRGSRHTLQVCSWVVSHGRAPPSSRVVAVCAHYDRLCFVLRCIHPQPVYSTTCVTIPIEDLVHLCIRLYISKTTEPGKRRRRVLKMHTVLPMSQCMPRQINSCLRHYFPYPHTFLTLHSRQRGSSRRAPTRRAAHRVGPRNWDGGVLNLRGLCVITC
ncbi:hypothetical protein PHLGIDRAFT_452053 [Phlebiopsis gigantea 11061_1 CR5-6]|uniref:Uncharacterized protein n=1 Tax=Phlebiopsis gigantea (strain 11061_1 CR5-6) TaxID=745531 RepID=A0A0C3S730_PHLG1|nr:hypothetical protein PHLGIDRAFT_452053 [Phlebiopsis gigantea 11061_1 CR5-6]